MTNPTGSATRPWQDAVSRARSGDAGAFAEVVREFSGLAIAIAQAWLGDADAAQDVAQEAFLDAHQHLAELRDPAAFVAWFRRIVIKHSDRLTRRRAPPRMSLDDAPQVADPGPGPEGALDNVRETQRARLAIEALPAAERLVFALAHLGEYSGKEIAEFLDLPLSTVKKRLRTARAHLRDDEAALSEAPRDRVRTIDAARLSDEVCFFIALRAGDRARVRALLQRRPELVEARQEWSAELTFGDILPFPNRATALIAAVERDDPELVRLLLDAGADPNGRCGCATEEPPLWTAAVFGRFAAARLLLDHGADPNATAASGTTPLHVAAMRGHAELVEMLLAAGADPSLPHRGGNPDLPWRTTGSAAQSLALAADWARRGGHHALALRLERACSREPADLAVVAPPIAASCMAASGMLETGIRALDLFTPLPRGGLVYVPFRAGVGMVVLLGELCSRIARRPRGAAVWTGFTQRPFDVGDLLADFAELGLSGLVEPCIAGLDASPEARRHAFARGLAHVETLCREGRDVLAVVTIEPGFASDVDAALAELANMPGPGHATTLVVGPFEEVPSALPALRAPWRARIVLDRARADRKLFPAIDPVASESQLSQEGVISKRHASLIEAARACLADLALRDPGFDTLARAAEQGEEAGHRLLRMLCQPFSTATPFTGLAGEHTALDDLLGRTEVALRGTPSERPPVQCEAPGGLQ